jgi:hypothetical protein
LWCAQSARESLLLEAGWAGILLAAQPGGASSGAGAPPALLLLRWQLFKACVLDGTAKLRVACAAAGDLGECFLRVAATAAVQGAPNWWVAAPHGGGAMQGKLEQWRKSHVGDVSSRACQGGTWALWVLLDRPGFNLFAPGHLV